jgi:hypothetical protein
MEMLAVIQALRLARNQLPQLQVMEAMEGVHHPPVALRVGPQPMVI